MSVVLTTHSMEEAEALCNRIGIMVKGQLQVLGSVQHLKTRFGDGYELEVHSDNLHMADIQLYIQEQFPGAELQELHFGHVKYKLPFNGQSQLRLATVFEKLESQKHILGIRDYAVSQTSLEQIFIKVARKKEHEEEESDQE
jgi:ABC-type multidrug transport system ATPase subunit